MVTNFMVTYHVRLIPDTQIFTGIYQGLNL